MKYTSIFLVLVVISVMLMSSAYSVTYLTGCANISAPGVYVLSNDITYSSTNDTCFYINSSDVVLDGAGHYIQSDTITNPTHAIKLVGVSNVTVENIKSHGPLHYLVFGSGVSNSTFKNIFVDDYNNVVGEAVVLYYSNNDTISNVTYNTTGGFANTYTWWVVAGKVVGVRYSNNIKMLNITIDIPQRYWSEYGRILVYKSNNVTLDNVYVKDDSIVYVTWHNRIFYLEKYVIYDSDNVTLNNVTLVSDYLGIGSETPSHVTISNSNINGLDLSWENNSVLVFGNYVNGYGYHYDVNISNSNIYNMYVGYIDTGRYYNYSNSGFKISVSDSNISSLLFTKSVFNLNFTSQNSNYDKIDYEVGLSLFNSSNYFSFYNDTYKNNGGIYGLGNCNIYPKLTEPLYSNSLYLACDYTDNLTNNFGNSTVLGGVTTLGYDARNISYLKLYNDGFDSNYTKVSANTMELYNVHNLYVYDSNDVNVKDSNGLIFDNIKTLSLDNTNNTLVKHSEFNLNVLSDSYNFDACESMYLDLNGFDLLLKSPYKYYPDKCCSTGLVVTSYNRYKYVDFDMPIQIFRVYNTSNVSVSLYLNGTKVGTLNSPGNYTVEDIYRLFNIKPGTYSINVTDGSCFYYTKKYLGPVGYRLLFMDKILNLTKQLVTGYFSMLTNESINYFVVGDINGKYKEPNIPVTIENVSNKEITFNNVNFTTVGRSFVDKPYELSYNISSLGCTGITLPPSVGAYVVPYMVIINGTNLNIDNIIRNGYYNSTNVDSYIGTINYYGNGNIYINGGESNSMLFDKCTTGYPNVTIRNVVFYPDNYNPPLIISCGNLTLYNVTSVGKPLRINIGTNIPKCTSNNTIIDSDNIYINDAKLIKDSGRIYINNRNAVISVDNVKELVIKPLLSTSLTLYKPKISGRLDNLIFEYSPVIAFFPPPTNVEYNATINVTTHHAKIYGYLINVNILDKPLPPIRFDTNTYGYLKQYVWLNNTTSDVVQNLLKVHKAYICFDYNASNETSIYEYDELTGKITKLNYTVNSNGNPCITVVPKSLYILFDKSVPTPISTPTHNESNQQIPQQPVQSKSNYLIYIVLMLILIFIVVFFKRRKRK